MISKKSRKIAVNDQKHNLNIPLGVNVTKGNRGIDEGSTIEGDDNLKEPLSAKTFVTSGGFN